MTMREFRHINAGSIEEAAIALRETAGKANVMAGGTDLLGTLKDKVHPVETELVVNLKTVPGLAYITETDEEGLKIGSMTRLSEIEKNGLILKKYPLLAEATRSVATPQIRNMGTIGGNICQEPRCWYYRKDDNLFHCLRKGGDICYAITGENQIHSVYGAGKVEQTSCSKHCPGDVKIPEYMALIRANKIDEAARILMENNPIPAITGRVCPHTCTEGCNRREVDNSVEIRNVERYIGDYVLEHAGEMYLPGKSSGKSAAVIGSGPAGLSAAYYLRKSGHDVMVFEKQDKAGGMLAFGIPAYRLPKDLVQKQVEALENMGIKFKTGIAVGTDIPFETITKDFDNVFIGTGAWVQPKAGLEFEERLLSGIEFGSNVIKGTQGKPGNNVLVIGGGNVAVDVALTARRLGAEKVTMGCLETKNEMPAIKHDVEEALNEGIVLMNGWGMSEVLMKDGTLSGMRLVKCVSVFDEDGRFNPKYDTSTTQSIEADCVILAIGQQTDVSFIDRSFKLVSERNLITVDMNNQSSTEGIYAGGDVVSGPATIIEAIAAGRRASERIIFGADVSVDQPISRKEEQVLLTLDNSSLEVSEPQPVKVLPLEERDAFKEDVVGLTSEQALLEARRCHNCGCIAASPSDIAPALVALDAVIVTSKRKIVAETFFATKDKSGTILDQDEIVLEVKIPARKANQQSAFVKYRVRKSIDFPLVDIAISYTTNKLVVEDTRIVLGAVAPIPLRIRAAEEFLNGKTINDAVAREFAEIVVNNSRPLKKNRYKIEYIRAFARRLLLEQNKK